MLQPEPSPAPSTMDAQNDSCVHPALMLSESYRSATRRLARFFEERRPAAVIIADGRMASATVIDGFLASLDGNTAVARISEPCADAGTLLRQIVTAAGFDPKDMSASDLQSILRMFLSFQKSHGRRTVICMEQIQDSEWWVLDRIRHLVELESRSKFGLLLVISGQPGLKELLHTRPLNAVSVQAGERIVLRPFTMEETVKFVEHLLQQRFRASVDERFEFSAIELLYELSRGVPDAIAALVSIGCDLSRELGQQLVTAALVRRAFELQCGADYGSNTEESATANLNGLQPRAGRLIVQISDEAVGELVVRYGHILIGRSKLCDIRVGSATVSRYHALISYTLNGVMLVDLGSTNGTFVDGYAIKNHTLSAGETITLGDCKIEYVLDDDLQTPMPDTRNTALLPERELLAALDS